MPARAHRVLIPFAALLAILPILLTGPSCGHDFDFHLLSWLEAATQFAHLHYPRWAYTPAYNAGEPRFLFYPPISWSLGAALGLILPWKLVPAAFTWSALTLSGFTMHAFARRYTGQPAATLAAILYLANPYMLFTAYERTAYGELLAAAWLPVLFAAALAPRLRIVTLAIPVALLWLTNAPAAVMGCYALAFLALVRLILSQTTQTPGTPSHTLGAPSQTVSSSGVGCQMSRTATAFTTLAATLLGLALAAFYLVPAIAERPLIQSNMATIEGMRIADNTLFHRMSPPTEDNIAHDVVLHTASLLSVTLLAAILLTLFVTQRGARRASFSLPSSLFPLLLLVFLIAFLLTPLSLPIWNHVPELRFLQFPWRLTAILGTLLALFAAIALDRDPVRDPDCLQMTPVRASLAALALASALILPAWNLFHQPCDLEDTVEARVALYHSPRGTEPTDEYTPTPADNDSLGKSDPPYWLASTPSAKPPADPPGPAPAHLALTLPTPEFLILNLREYPGWRIALNGNPIAALPETRDDGLTAIHLPAGRDTIDVAFALTPDEILGLTLTALAVLLALAILIHGFAPKESPHKSLF